MSTLVGLGILTLRYIYRDWVFRGKGAGRRMKESSLSISYVIWRSD